MEMENKWVTKGNFSDLQDWKNPEISSESENSDVFGSFKVEALKKSVEEIHEMILSRERLSRKIHEEGESLKSEIKGYLAENERMQIAPSDPSREKDSLRHKKIEISELQMNEKISCWKDVALLKKELREYERELLEKEERAKAFQKILNGDENGI